MDLIYYVAPSSGSYWTYSSHEKNKKSRQQSLDSVTNSEIPTELSEEVKHERTGGSYMPVLGEVP